MTGLLRGTDLIGRPVVTLDGDDVGEVKDVVLGLEDVALRGFTLRKHGALGGPLPQTLPWEGVHAVGDDAVMIEDAGALRTDADAPNTNTDPMIDIDVLTDHGDRLGRLVDVVIEPGEPAKVVGFEILFERDEADRDPRVLIPVTEMVAVSGRALVVPDAATSFMSRDLSGLDAGREGFQRLVEQA
jgi:sporulation protein YlmC with PRC-barrel domain